MVNYYMNNRQFISSRFTFKLTLINNHKPRLTLMAKNRQNDAKYSGTLGLLRPENKIEINKKTELRMNNHETQNEQLSGIKNISQNIRSSAL